MPNCECIESTTVNGYFGVNISQIEILNKVIIGNSNANAKKNLNY